MACNCKHNKENIEQGLNLLNEFRDLFIKRLSVDKETDRRRKDYNQAIFFYSEFTDEWKQSFTDLTMEMILEKFDLAVKDYAKG